MITTLDYIQFGALSPKYQIVNQNRERSENALECQTILMKIYFDHFDFVVQNPSKHIMF